MTQDQACAAGKYDKFIQQVQDKIRGKELAIECENAVLDKLAIYYERWEQYRSDAWAKTHQENRLDIPQSAPELLIRVRQRLNSMKAVKDWEKDIAMLKAALELFVKHNEPV